MEKCSKVHECYYNHGEIKQMKQELEKLKKRISKLETKTLNDSQRR